MAKFEATVINSSGKTTQAYIDAPNQSAAERIAKRKGKLVSIRRRWGLDMTLGMSPSDRYTFLARMSSMMGAKLGTAESLRLISVSFGGPIRRVAIGLLDKVESGLDLPAAMAQDRKNFPPAMVALIKAGVHSGETWRALKDAAEFEYRMQSIRKGATKELAQALLSFVIAGAITVGTSHWLGPMMMSYDIFKNNSGVNVDWVYTAADIMTIIMVSLLAVVGLLVWLATMGKRIMPLFADRVILKVPFYKDLVLARNNYATLYKLGLLIGAGVRVEEAHSIAEDHLRAEKDDRWDAATKRDEPEDETPSMGMRR